MKCHETLTIDLTTFECEREGDHLEHQAFVRVGPPSKRAEVELRWKSARGEAGLMSDVDQ